MSPLDLHRKAVTVAVLVTFLWSSSWILIKWGLDTLPPLTFAGLRYFLGFLCLLPFALRYGRAAPNEALTRRDWLELLGYGLLFYAITQGAQFMALGYLPAASLSLLLNLSPLLIAVLGFLLLGERLVRSHGLALMLCMSGVLIYFDFNALSTEAWIGIFLGMLCLLANSLSAVAGRAINRRGRHPAALITLISMGAGSLSLLLAGFFLEPWPVIGWAEMVLIGWLAMVNTALAFVLWNRALSELNATEAGLINNAMLPQIAILAWIFLDEALGAIQILAIALIVAALIVLQRQRQRHR